MFFQEENQGKTKTPYPNSRMYILCVRLFLLPAILNNTKRLVSLKAKV